MPSKYRTYFKQVIKQIIKMVSKCLPAGKRGELPTEELPGEAVTTPASQKNEPTLHGIPVELQVLVLRQAYDISALRNLVLSSRFYWEAYIGQRRSILQDVLFNALSTSVFLDALSVVNARRIGTSTLLGADRLDETRRVQVREEWLSNTYEFLRHYRETNSNMPQRIELEYLEEMSRLSCSVQVVARQFFKTTLSKHPLTGEELGLKFEDLSKTELQRIYGAIIRLETCCALWGDMGRSGEEIKQASQGSAELYAELYNLAKLFFAKFYPWEVEQIACVRDFLFRFYSRVYKDVEAEFEAVDLNPKFWLYQFLPVYRQSQWVEMLERYTALYYDNMSEIYMSCGVELHAKMIQCGGGPRMTEKRRRYMRERGKLGVQFQKWFLSDALPTCWYLDDDEGDSRPILTSENSPNAAWARYVASFEHEAPVNRPSLNHSRVYLRLWGFVMWDQARLEKLGLKEMDLSIIPPRGPNLWSSYWHS
jgi:hypothetical protein